MTGQTSGSMVGIYAMKSDKSLKGRSVIITGGIEVWVEKWLYA